MPAKSKRALRFFEAVQHNPDFAKKVDVPQSVGKEMTEGNVGEKSYENLPEQKSSWMDAPRWSKLKERLNKKG